MFQKLPVDKSQICVWVFIPYCITKEGLVSEFYGHLYHQQFKEVFAELGIAWKWQQITFENMHAVVEEVVASNPQFIPVVLNYCDGNEIDGYPGISVIKLLEANNIIFTGADSKFFELSSSKILMKQLFLESAVSTSPYEVISDLNKIEGICQRLTPPLFIKPSDYYVGIGLSSKSIVQTDQEIYEQIQCLLAEKEYEFTLGNIYVERFINGREFTVLIVGFAEQPEHLKLYPPMEYIFDSSLPEFKRFKCYELMLTADVEEFLSGASVASPLAEKLTELSKRAYCAVGGNGYGRVDIRMDTTTQELFVLEVNANCTISSKPLSQSYQHDQTSVGTILHLAGISFSELILQFLTDAFARHSNQLPLVYLENSVVS